MKKIEKQQENIKHLLKLIEENPTLEILPMVATECVFSDDFGYWMAEWGEARIDEYYLGNERVYSKSNDFDSLVDAFMNDNYGDYPDLSDEEFQKLAEEKVNNYEWTKAIIVRIHEL
jgi:hypothetical protein